METIFQNQGSFPFDFAIWFREKKTAFFFLLLNLGWVLGLMDDDGFVWWMISFPTFMRE